MINKNILAILSIILLSGCTSGASKSEVAANKSVETIEPASGTNNTAPLTTDEARQATY